VREPRFAVKLLTCGMSSPFVGKHLFYAPTMVIKNFKHAPHASWIIVLNLNSGLVGRNQVLSHYSCSLVFESTQVLFNLSHQALSRRTFIKNIKKNMFISQTQSITEHESQSQIQDSFLLS